MISDAYVMFSCDECGADEEVQLPVVYSSYAGSDPHADLRDSALEKLLPKRWLERDGKHLCEDCKGDEC
jgi:hypothetical protein